MSVVTGRKKDMSAPLADRYAVIDAVRGLAICAVVLGHAAIGVVSAGLAEQQHAAFARLITALYLVHMPLFAFLMGLNLPQAWQRRKHPTYMISRVLFFLWLYLVWTLIQGLSELAAASLQNGQGTTVADILTLWVPLAHLWFLPWAATATVLIILTRLWQRSWTSVLALLTLAVISVMTWGNTHNNILSLGNSILIFAALGAVVGIKKCGNVLSCWGIGHTVMLLISWGIYLYILLAPVENTRPTGLDAGRSLETITVGILGCLAGCVAFILTISCIYHFISLKWLEVLGKLSLQIFLAHLLFTPAVRIVLVKIGITDPTLITLVATGAGICGPLGLYYLTRSWLPWLFDTPWKISATQ